MFGALEMLKNVV